MHEGKVESTRYPRNPLDVLAQQIVAIAGLDTWRRGRAAPADRAPRRALRRPRAARMFDGVLDMLVGPLSLRRVRRAAAARHLGPASKNARRRARGRGARGDRQRRHDSRSRPLRRVPRRRGPADARRRARRGDGVRDQVGETFTLGASTWRVEEITHDRVLVSPAPGEPGKMPFWHGDQAGPPGRARPAPSASWFASSATRPKPAAIARLIEHHGLDRRAAENLLQYLDEQAAAGGRARRSHDRHRALPRRARRLARVRALAVRQPHPRAVGDGGHGARAQPHRAWTSR